MILPSRLSLRTKSILLMMLTGFAALVFAVIAFIGYELLMFRQSAENETLAVARIISINSVASLSFNDHDAAKETLASISGEPSIVCAGIYDRNAELFAHVDQEQNVHQNSDIPATLDPDISLGRSPHVSWKAMELTVHFPIMLEKDRVGTVLITTEQQGMVQRIMTYLVLSAVIFAVSSALAYVISLYSQRFLTSPVVSLQQTMLQVATSRNFALRATVETSDELGQLSDGFNTMLDQIQQQDQELREHREMLEENVRVRTAELSRTNASLHQTVEELQIAKDRAEAANMAKMQFLANISHEIRTPMNGILGIAEILDRSELSDRQRQLLRTLQQSGSNLMSIINDLLDFSKLEAGKFDLIITSFNLHALLDNCIDVFSAGARDKALEIACIIHPEVPVTIQSDPDRLRQILTNLLGNAVKFTTAGSVVIRATLGSGSGTQGQLILQVEDTGIGIPANAMERIFSPFTQADETMTRTHGGTGLGLTIVHQLVTLMEGHIDVRSEINQGSVFTVTIPFIYPEHGETIHPQVFKGITVCSIGLSALSRTALENILSRYGITSRHHVDVDEALRHPVARPDRHICFLSEQATDEDTEAAIAQLRAPSVPRTTLVLLTSSLHEHEAGENAVDLVLSKPLRQSDIQNIVLDIAGVADKPIADSRDQYPENVVFDARVLLVEDNEVNQKVAGTALELFGLHVTVAGNGQEALDITARSSFDLIFMDCQMPVMDGYTASTRIREEETRRTQSKRVPIVALTAHALIKDRLLCFQKGMDDYLAKPFTLAELFRCLKQWLPERLRETGTAGATHSGAPSGETLEEVLDPAILNTLRAMQSKGSSDLIRILFSTYARSSAELLDAVNAGMAATDLDAVRQHCHTLKSSSHNVGAAHLGRIAQAMEGLAKDGHVADLTVLHARMVQEHHKVMQAIAQLEEER